MDANETGGGISNWNGPLEDELFIQTGSWIKGDPVSGGAIDRAGVPYVGQHVTSMHDTSREGALVDGVWESDR
jgi:hypothetical protein